MKKWILCLAISGLSMPVFAQSDRYMAAMEKNVALVNNTSSSDSLQMLSNNFQRIAETERTQWLPYYYAGFCQAMIAFQETDMSKVDGYADQAESFVQKADSLSPNNSEIVCLKSMVASSRIKVDPASRGQQYGMESGEDLQTAQGLDPSNPRVYFLQGESKFYTPANYGGGKDAAKPLFQKALEKYASFKPKSDIDPSWGEAYTRMLLAECNQ